MSHADEPWSLRAWRWLDEHCYRSLPFHALFLGLVMVAVMGGYLLAKRPPDPDQAPRPRPTTWFTRGHFYTVYSRISQRSLDNATNRYGVRSDPGTGDLKLDGDELTLASGDATGFERLPAFRSALASCRRRLAAHNAAAEVAARSLLNQWLVNDGDRDVLLIPITGAAGPGVIEIPLAANHFQRLTGGFRLLGELYTVISRPRLHWLATPATTTTPPTATALDWHGTLTALAATAKQLHASEDPSRLLVTPADQAILVSTVGALIGQRLVEAGDPAVPGTREVLAGRPLHLVQAEDQLLREQLKGIVQEDLGFFWLVGYWRWMEVTSWCAFGVLAQALLHTGYFLLNWQGRERWKPRSLIYTLLQLVHVPVMSLVVFWLWTYSSTDAGPMDATRSTPALLAYAFVFGLFPTLAYDLLRKFAATVRTGLAMTNATPSEVELSRRVTVDAPALRPQGAPPSYGELRSRVKAIVTAPIS